MVDQKIEAIVSEVLKIPSNTVTDDLTMKDVESWDSLKHMELVVSLEESFGIQFSFEEIVTMQSVSEIKRVLNERSPSH